MQATYLILVLLSVSIPFLYSFHPKMRLIKWWKPIFVSISITALLFIIWDIFFTIEKIWGFNPDYLLGINLIYLPIEEWLFFWLIPYASLFIYYSFQYFKPNWILTLNTSKYISYIIIFITLMVVLSHYDKTYTLINFLMLWLILVFATLKKPYLLQRFYLAYLVVLIPFFIVNGILTGMLTPEPIVWYNNTENMGIRIITIPIEDFAYAFSMLLLSLTLIDYQTKIKFINN